MSIMGRIMRKFFNAPCEKAIPPGYEFVFYAEGRWFISNHKPKYLIFGDTPWEFSGLPSVNLLYGDFHESFILKSRIMIYFTRFKTLSKFDSNICKVNMHDEEIPGNCRLCSNSEGVFVTDGVTIKKV